MLASDVLIQSVAPYGQGSFQC